MALFLLYNKFMILFINTIQGDEIELIVSQNKKVLARKKFQAKYRQAEKLLPAIDSLLKHKKIKLSDMKMIKVANQGKKFAPGHQTGFTALRIGVATANALGYALGIPVVGSNGLKTKNKEFNIIKPIYHKEPNITMARKAPCG